MGLHFIKNGTKHDVCVKRPSLFPASATTYDNTNHPELPNRAQGAIDELAGKVWHKEVRTFTLNSSGISYVDPKYILLVATDNTGGGYLPVRLNSSYMKVLDTSTMTFITSSDIEYSCYYFE